MAIIKRGCPTPIPIWTNISDDGHDGDDHYRVVLWIGKAKTLKVLKEYTS